MPFGGWDGVRDALKDGHIPKQSQMMPLPGEDPNASQGDEDCLVLNVFINEVGIKGFVKNRFRYFSCYLFLGVEHSSVQEC